jgi:hypothetical protein
LAAVELTDEAKADVTALAQKDAKVAREALRIALALKDDPYRGERLRVKANRKRLAEADCRKVKFDHPGRSANAKLRYRYRLVYRIEPHEGSPQTIVVMSIGEKEVAYAKGTARAARRLREEATQRIRRHPSAHGAPHARSC